MYQVPLIIREKKKKDTKTALKNCGLWLYADNMGILYSHQNVKAIEINSDFNNLFLRR